MPHFVSGINSPFLSVNLIPVYPSVTCLFLLLPHLLTLCQLTIQNSLFHFQLKTYLFHISSHHRLPSGSGLRTDSTDFMTGMFLLSISVLGGPLEVTVGWIKMPLGTKVSLGLGDIVLDGDSVPSLFGQCLLWPNGRPSQQLLSSWQRKCIYFSLCSAFSYVFASFSQFH